MDTASGLKVDRLEEIRRQLLAAAERTDGPTLTSEGFAAFEHELLPGIANLLFALELASISARPVAARPRAQPAGRR